MKSVGYISKIICQSQWVIGCRFSCIRLELQQGKWKWATCELAYRHCNQMLMKIFLRWIKFRRFILINANPNMLSIPKREWLNRDIPYHRYTQLFVLIIQTRINYQWSRKCSPRFIITCFYSFAWFNAREEYKLVF